MQTTPIEPLSSRYGVSVAEPLREDATARGDIPDLSWRVLSLLNVFRLLVALVLLALFYISGEPRAVGGHEPALFLFTVFAYLLLSIGAVYSLSRRIPAFAVQVYWQVGLDIVAITTLMHASGGVESGLGNLLIVSIGGASLTLLQRTAGLFAALTALALLAEQGISQFEFAGGPADSTATGVLGAIIFIIALAAQPLARRIRESEALAVQRGVDLENLAELNDYIIHHLRESIVVVDSDNRIRLLNESAAQILGCSRHAHGQQLASVSPRLHIQVLSWRENPERQRATPSSFVGGDGATNIMPHLARLGRAEPAAILVFLEDLSMQEERAQQSKLAALGRLSASIAHEIRNPVGAMSHAGQLLAESPTLGSQEKRLTDIIHHNADRISTIVSNVLQLSKRDYSEPEQIHLARWLTGFCEEFRGSNELLAQSMSVTHRDSALEVRMDPSHLHQVLWNLCDNALKYAAGRKADHIGSLAYAPTGHERSSEASAVPSNAAAVDQAAETTDVSAHDAGPEAVLPGQAGEATVADAPPGKETTVRLQTGRIPSNGRPFLQVCDSGPGIPEAMVERIFEPFISSKSGGTGLGLFIARQLCECNGATLVYLPNTNGGSIFRIVFADPRRWTTDT